MANPASELMVGVFEIAGAIVGVALIALLLNRNANTVAVVKQAGSSFDQLLRTVTLQGGFGNYGGF